MFTSKFDKDMFNTDYVEKGLGPAGGRKTKSINRKKFDE